MCTVHRFALLGVVLVGGAFLLSGLAGADNERPAWEDARWLLFPTQDESSLEVRLAEYLEVRGIRFEVENAKEDAIVRLSYELDEGYVLQMSIDSWRSATEEKDGSVRERILVLTGLVVMPDGIELNEHRMQYMEHINAWHYSRLSVDRIILDDEGDLWFKSLVNIPGPTTPIHAEMIYDMILRMVDSAVQFVRSLATVETGAPAPEGAPAPGSSGG